MAEQYARPAEQHLSRLPQNQQAQVTKDENTLAKFIIDVVAQGIAWDVAKRAKPHLDRHLA